MKPCSYLSRLLANRNNLPRVWQKCSNPVFVCSPAGCHVEMKLSTWSVTMAVAVLGVAANLVFFANKWMSHALCESLFWAPYQLLTAFLGHRITKGVWLCWYWSWRQAWKFGRCRVSDNLFVDLLWSCIGAWLQHDYFRTCKNVLAAWTRNIHTISRNL